MKIAWSIKIPFGAKLKVKSEESVKSGQLIYEYHQNVVERLPLVGWQDLSFENRKIILQNIIKSNIIKGEIIGKTGFFSHNELRSPGSGKCLGVDEFGNIEFENEKDEKYFAPVSAKKIRIEEEKIIFELKGMEFEVDGLNQLKAWGEFDGLIIDDPDKITNFGTKKIVLIVNSLESAVKAEAIGAVGLILVNVDMSKDLEYSDIPIVLMEPEVLVEFKKFVSNQEVKIWLNASMGKVVVVLE